MTELASPRMSLRSGLSADIYHTEVVPPSALPPDARGEASILGRRTSWLMTRLERLPTLQDRGLNRTALPPKPNNVDKDRLALAVRAGTLEDVRTLLNDGADPNVHDKHGNTPLHNAAVAGSVDKAQLLFECGANLEAHNRFGRTPLHSACDIGWPEVVKILVRLGANVHAKDGPLLDGETPFQVAQAAGWPEVQAALQANERRRVKQSGGGTALFSCDFRGPEPPPFSPRTMNKDSSWGVNSKHGIWGSPPDLSKPLFKTRVTA